MARQKYQIMGITTNTGAINSKCCKFEAIDSYSYIVEIVILAITVIMAIFLIRNIIILLKQGEFKGFLKRIYFITIGWFLSTFIKCSINISAYWEFMKDQQQIQDTSVLAQFSGAFWSFDILSTLFVVQLLILIPYKWIKQTLMFLSADESSEILIPHRKSIDLTFKILNVIRIYAIVRVPIIIALIVMDYLLIINDTCEPLWIPIIVYVIESILCIFLYCFGQRQMRQLKIYIPLDPKDYHKLKIEYQLLMLACISRALYHCILIITDDSRDIKFHNCGLTQTQKTETYFIIKNTIFLVMGQILMHFLSIAVVLYIYKPERKEQSISSKQNYQVL